MPSPLVKKPSFKRIVPHEQENSQRLEYRRCLGPLVAKQHGYPTPPIPLRPRLRNAQESRGRRLRSYSVREREQRFHAAVAAICYGIYFLPLSLLLLLHTATFAFRATKMIEETY
jgi:hypothetical protein